MALNTMVNGQDVGYNSKATENRRIIDSLVFFLMFCRRTILVLVQSRDLAGKRDEVRVELISHHFDDNMSSSI